jgi:hypothetical protein
MKTLRHQRGQLRLVTLQVIQAQRNHATI